MDDEIQLISDGSGVAVIGDSAAVERFLAAEGLPSKDLGLPKARRVLGTGRRRRARRSRPTRGGG